MTSFAIRSLYIKNFKALDELHVEFPKPRFDGDPDIIVLGSENGLGKTSVLQCVALLIMSAMSKNAQNLFAEEKREGGIDLANSFVRAGAESAELEGVFELGTKSHSVSLSFSRNGQVKSPETPPAFKKALGGFRESRARFSETMRALAGMSNDPLFLPRLLFFHSHRKVQEGSPHLGAMLDGPFRGPYRLGRSVFSQFKIEILRMIMGKADLFENLIERDESQGLEQLNDLVETYAGGRIGKLRPEADNTLDIRIGLNGSERQTFSFDGLSSGQKEIISTLFMISRLSALEHQQIVLIDEPELHLNAEWHSSLVKYLVKTQPQNQYILASHSQQVFAAVESPRRLILEKN